MEGDKYCVFMRIMSIDPTAQNSGHDFCQPSNKSTELPEVRIGSSELARCTDSTDASCIHHNDHLRLQNSCCLLNVSWFS